MNQRPDEIRRIADPGRFRSSLARWFARRQRPLPWRKPSDSYAIWVSEIMLQQTRVEAVIGRYERFLAAFPSPAALAAAGEDEVLAHWSGLGYYSRARNLHRGAKVVVARHHGLFPRDPEPARAIPGVGAYTAAAILSIAYGRPLPAVDGNVRRVLTRLHRLEPPNDRAPRVLEAAAASLLDRRNPGRHNQAMMELGALVCTPRAPDCAECPVSFACLAHQEGAASEYPRRQQRKEPARLRPRMLLLRDGRGRLLLQLGGWSLLDHLWLPLLLPEEGDPARLVARRYSPEVASALGRLEEIGTVTHSITHHRIRCRVLSGAVGPLRRLPGHLRLARDDEIAGLGRSSLLDKALRLEAGRAAARADGHADGGKRTEVYARQIRPRGRRVVRNAG